MLKRLILTIVFLLSINALTVVAQFDNDPNVNPDANACFEGGAMEGKCNQDSNGDGEVSQAEIDWAWTCGWYLIRIDHTSEDDRATFPASCVSLLKALYIPVPEVVVEAAPAFPSADCIYGAWYGGYLKFGGGYFLSPVFTPFTDSTCTTPTGANWADNVVYAPVGYDPLVLCQQNGSFNTALGVGDDLYVCFP